jgi:GcrA cell cycle regulator
MTHAINAVWTVERIDLLTTLWATEEYSCAGIAARLGGGISRSAVIGKACRLGLAKKRTNGPAFRRPRRTVQKNGAGFINIVDNDQSIDADVSSLRELEAQPKPDTFLGIPLANLEPHHCRYPRDIDGQRLFCGQPKLEDSSYCAACHRRTHAHGGYRLTRRAA